MSLVYSGAHEYKHKFKKINRPVRERLGPPVNINNYETHDYTHELERKNRPLKERLGPQVNTNHYALQENPSEKTVSKFNFSRHIRINQENENKKSKNCVCNRIRRYILCVVCGWITYGRVQISCKQHPQVGFLMDFPRCLSCNAVSAFLTEIEACR